MPKATVLTTFHNGRKTIEKAIESILNQSFKDFEYLLVDDSSTDETILCFGRIEALNLTMKKTY